MPRLSVYFVRASLIYLLFSFTIGGLILANKGLMISAMIWSLLPLHIEFAFVGWMIQLAMGVAFWILPRFSKGPPRGNEYLSWWALLFVNAGILFVVLDHIFNVPGLSLAGRVAEMLGLITFVLGNWMRIKPLTHESLSCKEHIQSLEWIIVWARLPISPRSAQRTQRFSFRFLCELSVLCGENLLSSSF